MFSVRELRFGDDEALFRCLTPEVWRLASTPFGRSREDFAQYMSTAREAVAAGTAEVYVLIEDGKPCRMSRLWSLHKQNRSAEIGYTWYREDLWGSGINAIVKRTLLTRAFDELDLIRVYFRIDARNERSQAAVAKLGATKEGVLRHEMILPDGFVRDTIVYSILNEEWPGVRARLDERIASV